MQTDQPRSVSVITAFCHEIWTAAGGGSGHGRPVSDDSAGLAGVRFSSSDDLPSVYATSDLAAASIGAAALAIAELVEAGGGGGARPQVRIDRRLSSLWFSKSIRPVGWSIPPSSDPVTADYQTKDGWIRLHTNARRHLDAALAVLGVPGDRKAVAAAVSGWMADDLEKAVIDQGGCAATMRSEADWARHSQGRAVMTEPLLWREETGGAAPSASKAINPARPLAGIRVLDLTRILAGPIATRFLAGFGAEVLRIDPVDWDEPGLAPEVTLGKRCARLDLRRPDHRDRFLDLLSGADILIHGYRPGALDGLGLGADQRRRARTDLIDVSLSAYGWSGPWAHRRGFDSLVQMSSGIADYGMRKRALDRPSPLPVQALDHATGYILAAAAVRGLANRMKTGAGMTARASLARTAALLSPQKADDPDDNPPPPLTGPDDADFSPDEEATAWGPAHRLRPPVSIEDCPMLWDRPAAPLGSEEAAWR